MDGEFTRRLISVDSAIIASDVTFDLLKRAQENKVFKEADNLTFQTDDAEFLPFKDECLDFVCGVSILHHLDYRKALKECHRILKRNGELFFSEPNLLNPITVTFFNIPWLRKKFGASPNETALMRWKVADCLKETGFREVKVFNNDFLFPWIPDCSIHLLEGIGKILEKTPLIKEISGSIILYAKK